MIGDTLEFLRDQLDKHLASELDMPRDPAVVFLDGDKSEPIAFKLGAVSALLVNVEEERLMRQPDPYMRASSGTVQSRGFARVQPDIRLTLHILFVAHCKQYKDSWSKLSKIIQYFQTNRVFEQGGTIAPPIGVDRLALELVTLSLAQQNEIWSALRTIYHPSISYRASLVTLADSAPVELRQIDEGSVRLDIGTFKTEQERAQARLDNSTPAP